MHDLVVAVIGPGEASDEEEARAEEVGACLAGAGAIVVTGGLDGVMAAACRGARAAGGRTIGLLPGEDRHAANPWVQVAVPTGLGEARNVLVVRSADAVIAVGGGDGTLSEIGLALKLGRLVVGLDTWTPVLHGTPDPRVAQVDTPAAAVAAVLAACSSAAGAAEPTDTESEV